MLLIQRVGMEEQLLNYRIFFFASMYKRLVVVGGLEPPTSAL